MNKKSIINTILIALVLIATGISVYTYYLMPKAVYIDLNKTYNEFIYKKEMEKKLVDIQRLRQNILDSLKLNIEVLGREIDSEKAKNKSNLEKYKIKREEYLIKEKRFLEDNENMAQQYSSQIWQQLNQYVTDYGKSHNYTFVFGANGTGTLMYVDKNIEITDKVIQYVNNRYEGKVN